VSRLHGDGVIEPENVLCYLPVKEMCYFPDLTVMETLREVSSLSRPECQTVFLFPKINLSVPLEAHQ